MKIYNSLELIQQKVSRTEPLFKFDSNNNYNEWKNNSLSKLNELLGLPFERCDDNFIITGEKELEEYTKIDFEFQSEKDYYVRSSLLVPKGTNKQIPTAICLQGHSTGMHISLGEEKYAGDKELIAGGRDFAIRTVKEGFCAVVIDQRYMGEAGSGKCGEPACNCNNSAAPSLLLGRTAIGERVWDIQRLIDVLFDHFDKYIDKNNLICMGNSGGGTATFYASCLDDRIKISMPSCAVCTYDASIVAMNHCPCNYIPNIRKYFNMGDLGCLIYPRKFVLVCGIHDPIFPVDGVEKSFDIIKNAYENYGHSELCQIVKGEGGHQFYPDEAWPVIHKLING